MGSLYTALASYLQARSKNGKWFLRIDDLDTFRTVTGATDSILHTLENYHFYWDGPVVYQSLRTEAYSAAFDKIEKQGLIYACRCSRKSLARRNTQNHETIRYPEICRNKNHSRSLPHSLRIKTDGKDVSFHDQLQGPITQKLSQTCGDFIIKRKDNLFAYHLAVVIDDHKSHITEVLRGIDLLESTPQQSYLQRTLSIPQPKYAHIPIVVDNSGSKLSKQTGAQPVSSSNRSETLFNLLTLLRQAPPKEIRTARVDDIIEWGIKHWDISKLGKQKKIVFNPVD